MEKPPEKNILGSISPFWIGIPHLDQGKFKQSGLTKTRISPGHPKNLGPARAKFTERAKHGKRVVNLIPTLSQKSWFPKPLRTRIPGSDLPATGVGLE